MMSYRQKGFCQERERERERERNYGICILRIIFIFQVVIGHCGNVQLFAWLGGAVPFFMFTSFFLTYKMFLYPDFVKLKYRVFRIFEPYIFYALFSYMVLSMEDAVLGTSHVSVKALFYQLLAGSSRSLDPPLWFLFDLIICSIVIFLVSYYCKYKKSLLFAILLISFLFQYSEINLKLFGGLSYEFKWPLGRLAEMLPYACAGVLIGDCGIIQKYFHKVNFLVILFILAIYFEHLTFNNFNGFYYNGLRLFLTTLLIFPVFYNIDLNNVNKRIKHFIVTISNFSMGLFCIHYIILLGYNNARFTFLQGFWKGVGIYLLSLGVCFLVARIPSKWAQNLVQ